MVVNGEGKFVPNIGKDFDSHWVGCVSDTASRRLHWLRVASNPLVFQPAPVSATGAVGNTMLQLLRNREPRLLAPDSTDFKTPSTKGTHKS